MRSWCKSEASPRQKPAPGRQFGLSARQVRVADTSAAPHRRGLTLVELLATAAAVALLVAVLTPAVAGVRGRSKQTVCLQNLARIAEASIVYASADEDDQAVPIHPSVLSPAMSGDGRRQIAAVGWGGMSGLGSFEGDQFFWGTFKGMGPAARPLNKILYGDVFPDYRTNPGPGGSNWWRDASLDLSVYHCPSDSGYTGLHSTSWRDSRLTGFDHYGNSYVAPTLFVYVAGGSPNCQSNGVYWRSLGDISNPAQTLYYLETCGRYAFTAGPQGLPEAQCGTGSNAVVRGWHGQPWQFNSAFVDGHAETIHMRGFQNPPLGHYPTGAGFPDPHLFWRCVIIRGDDWQMDTLPLDPVETGISCQ